MTALILSGKRQNLLNLEWQEIICKPGESPSFFASLHADKSRHCQIQADDLIRFQLIAKDGSPMRVRCGAAVL